MTDIVEAPVAVKDLKTLANEIRIAHAAAGNTAQNFLEHILTAGDGLIEARKQVKHGEWGAWLKRECALPERDLSERTAQAYMQIARGRAALEANPQRAADLSLRGALRLLQPPTGGCTRHEGGNGCPEAKPKTNGYRKWTQEKTRHALLQMQRWNYKHPNDPCNYATMDRMRDFAGLRGKLSEMVS
jgi:hypothetical protein